MHSSLSEKLIKADTIRKNIENEESRIYSNIFKTNSNQANKNKNVPETWWIDMLFM